VAAVPIQRKAGQSRTAKGWARMAVIGEASPALARARCRPTRVHDIFIRDHSRRPKGPLRTRGRQPGGVDVELDKAVDARSQSSRPIRPAEVLLRLRHNWGVAIILLTLFIKILTFYSDAEVTALGEEDAEAHEERDERHSARSTENDSQRQSVETMNLTRHSRRLALRRRCRASSRCRSGSACTRRC